MNSSDKKNLYTALDEMLNDEMTRNPEPPAYHQQPQLQNQQSTSFAQNQAQQIPMPIGNSMPTNGIPSAQIQEIMMLNTPQVGPIPMVVTCPHCRARSKTTIRYSSTAKTHIACLLLSLTFCCCCLPYCIPSCKNANHYCSMCDAFIGSYRS